LACDKSTSAETAANQDSKDTYKTDYTHVAESVVNEPDGAPVCAEQAEGLFFELEDGRLAAEDKQ
jgi:hypothetical protein